MKDGQEANRAEDAAEPGENEEADGSQDQRVVKDIEFFEEREDQVVLQDEEIGSNEEADQDDLQVAAPLDFRVASFSQSEDKDDSNAAQQASCYREELADLRQ